MNQRIPLNLIKECLEQVISLDHQKQLDEWLASDEHRALFNEIQSLWLSLMESGSKPSTDIDQLWKTMNKRTSRKDVYSRRLFIQFSAAAAAVSLILLISTSFYLVKKWRDAQTITQTFSCVYGKTQVQLPDGSDVWLNSKTKLVYSFTPSKNERRVSLLGEALFHVAKDANRPFIVSNSGINVLVHGTTFDVKARDDDKDVLVTLIEGSVTVSSSISKTKIVPGEMALCSKSEGRIHVRDVQAADASFWAKESVTFDHNNIRQVVETLSKWYGISIAVSAKVPLDQAYTFTVRNESVEEILRLLMEDHAIQYRRIDDKNFFVSNK